LKQKPQEELPAYLHNILWKSGNVEAAKEVSEREEFDFYSERIYYTYLNRISEEQKDISLTPPYTEPQPDDKYLKMKVREKMLQFIHLGRPKDLEAEFRNFVKWLESKAGSESLEGQIGYIRKQLGRFMLSSEIQKEPSNPEIDTNATFSYDGNATRKEESNILHAAAGSKCKSCLNTIFFLSKVLSLYRRRFSFTALQCLDIVLKYAYISNVKSKLLDKENECFMTPLRVAILSFKMPLAKKLILEGANLFNAYSKI